MYILGNIFQKKYKYIINFFPYINHDLKILLINCNLELTNINKNDIDIFYYLPDFVKNILTSKTYIRNKIYSIETYIEEANNLNNKLIYIEKPINGSCGKGINILLNLNKWNKKNYILQKYIIPKLYNGHKFDIRILVCYCSNGKFKIFQDGIVRYAPSLFDIDINNEKHITNLSFQKKCNNIEKIKNFPQLLSNHIFYQDYMNKINIIINDILNDVHNNICHKIKRRFFRIVGFDIIFDKNDNGYFIECNSMPSLKNSNEYIQHFFDVSCKDLLKFGFDNV